jgi:exopolysaccharide production protein ExoZ
MNGSKNEGLQVARAFAALSVAYFHSYVALRGFPETAQLPIEDLKEWGFLGVNFFFAISGYVICLVVAKPGFSARAFVIKSIFRLYLMYWVTMMIVASMVVAGKYEPDTIGHFLYSMTLLPQHGATSYGVSWTLEREVVFYLLAMVVVPIGGVIGLALVLAALAAGGWHFGNPWSFHLVDTAQADFLGGVLVFLLSGACRRLGSIVPLAFGVVLLVHTRSHGFPFSATISFAIILVGMINLELPWQRWPLRWVVAAGDASYSIYLVHPIMFFWAYYLAANFPVLLPDWLCEPWRYLTIFVCCLLSYRSWLLIERPMIALGNRIAARRQGANTMSRPIAVVQPVPPD